MRELGEVSDGLVVVCAFGVRNVLPYCIKPKDVPWSMSVLNKFADNPKAKIHWALRVLRDHGHVLGKIYKTASATLYEIDGEQISVQQVYSRVTGFPEWNDRLGTGTARIPPVKSD